MSSEVPSSTAASAQQHPLALREDVIESAVRFLTDSKVQSSTLAKKIAFLETKGLTTEEIETALARSKSVQSSSDKQDLLVSKSSQSPAPAYGYASQTGPPVPPPPPSRPHLDWKDYFIAAVVAGGLGYGLYVLTKKYIMPLLMVCDDNKRLEEEKALLVEQNEATCKQLESLSDSTTRILDTIAQQSQKTSEAIESMASVLDRISTQEVERGSASNRLLLTLEDLQREISSLSSKMSKASETTVADVQSDIRSLRSLLLSRRVPAHGSSPGVPRPATPGTFASAFGASSPTSLAVDNNSASIDDVVDPAQTEQASNRASSPAAPIPTSTIPAWQLGLTSDETPNANKKGKQVAAE
ncbi:peroxisomal membrane protein pex14 [Coemansia spiralis]|uniref:Peroxisomal membrane protein PEX14 n=2 Tax=Coemansia TaxID=4863 RepID=A0A9W8L0F9_9FUNG|nr:peroxisomal membrane protein pex14 [Coemansia umbellata]KAJ2625081.1 peroxisomal membrane protein pex14 [Coemansia sp. RSA 1358]KAJ2679965.1 peroxisomal membrane protein pex14 [Coemansia spiralis]